MKLELDDWQQEVLATEGKHNLAIRAGRQVGKSTVISILASNFAINNPNKLVMIVASTERQAQLLFEKTLGYMADNHKPEICRGKRRPTKHIIQLKNGSRIYCLPTGLTGYGIRGYTIDLFIADEAAFIPVEVFDAMTPSLSVSKGKIILLSTPFGKTGFFYDAFKEDSGYKTWHIRSTDCPRHTKEFLESEKKAKTDLVWAQEYLGEFVDELRQFFPDELIKKCMTIEKSQPFPFSIANNAKFLGVDVARMGGDQSVLFSIARNPDQTLFQIGMEITTKTLLPATVRLIKHLDSKYDYKRIYIDTGGLGVGVFDPLLEDDQTKRKVVSIDNASKSIDSDDRRKRLLKEDLYTNLLRLMEQGSISLFNDPEIFQSLKSVQYEYKDARIKIFGNYTHVAEALIRAAWCTKDKALNIWIRFN